MENPGRGPDGPVDAGASAGASLSGGGSGSGSGSGSEDSVPRKPEGATSPPSSKRRKLGDEEDGVGDGSPEEPLKFSPESNIEFNNDDPDDRKPAAKEGKNELPLAPSLEAYLQSGGHQKYSPRPEWCRVTTGSAAGGGGALFMEGVSFGRSPLRPVGAGAAALAAAFAAPENPLALLRDNNDEEAPDRPIGGNDNEQHVDVNFAIRDDNVDMGGEDAVRPAPPEGRPELQRDDIRRDVELAGRRPGPGDAGPAGRGAGQQIRPNQGRHRHHHHRHHRGRDVSRRTGLQHLDQQRPDLLRRLRQLDDRQLGRRANEGRAGGIIRVGGGGPDGGERVSDEILGPPAAEAALLVRRVQGLRREGNNDLAAAILGIEQRQQQRHQQQQQEHQQGGADVLPGDGGGRPADANDAERGGGGENAARERSFLGQPLSPGFRFRPAPRAALAPNSADSSGKKASVFGFECDSALHLAIKQQATDAALDLIRAGAGINFPNAKGITPLMIASQEGNLEVVRALLKKGAMPNASTIRGSTSLIQACHFGKLSVVEELLQNGALVDQANLKNTTALMRASQEGHGDVVRLLLSRGAGVNRRNDERMTALMLSSQRGHAGIVGMLVRAGAQVDAKTAQDSTSLMLACKRKHLDVAKILVASGTELMLKDCKNRTVLETVTRRGSEEFAKILTDEAQVRLMQEDSRRERNFAMVRSWKLLQSERAFVRFNGNNVGGVSVHRVAEELPASPFCPSKRALVRAMTLPAPLIELISSFIPLPLIWEKRLMLLTSRSHIDPDSAVFNALDLIDEVLEVGGLLEAFDAARVTPPDSFESWTKYKAWCGKCDVILSRCADVDVTNIFAQVSDVGIEIVESTGSGAQNLRQVEPAQVQRRACNYLNVLARAPKLLSRVLSSHPYEMPSALFEKLRTSHDIQSVVRRFRGGGIHFDSSIANELLVTARMTVMWCESRPMY